MTFAHDTMLALRAGAALVNSAEPPDTLTDLDDLDAFLAQHPFTGRRDATDAELREVRALRPVLRGFWVDDEELLVERVNAVLAEYAALPQLTRHDGFGWHIHATAADRPLAARIAVELAMAMTDVLRAGERDRLGFCAADDCSGVVADLSRNRSRRYCESGCGNRVNVAAYRARRSAAAG
ncbi:CGNR zinc finger domain-containing protein [Naumannella cuiyingiana]|uniref:Putative RNA-binding Zn ribbon-like protein n=1 Tax=Naumannella cuiyingiana TaxID=1347891 RepID=A0A7Z0DA39_9ACTN|nr:CGNR zinc finger domain-containing protein [Naumannella cuiyingiana]NYI71488.1 putative RNA-binding Zn ribbon-like protein [Naumannella cuiyingiana]